jgi:hypothetical protein
MPLMVIGLIVAALLVGERSRVIMQKTTSTTDQTQVTAVLAATDTSATPARSGGPDVTAFMAGRSRPPQHDDRAGQEVTIDVFTMMAVRRYTSRASGSSTRAAPRRYSAASRTAGSVVQAGRGPPVRRRNRDDQDDQVESTNPAPVTAEREPPADSPSLPASAGEPTSSSAPRLVIRG